MKINKKQKTILIAGLFLIVGILILWIGFGGEIFTKTQVLVEKQDAIMGTTYKEWKNQFILGLDYSLGISGIITAITALGLYVFRNKK